MEPLDPASRFDLRDRVAIVTGGSRGIGLAISAGLGMAGAKVVVASRKADACAAAADELRGYGIDAVGVAAHVGELEALEHLVEETVRAFGAIDIVVNNAATPLAEPIGKQTPSAWSKAFDVNVRGPAFLVQYALPHLTVSEHASVVNVVSGAAFLHSEGFSLYAASKAALLALTRSMAGELAGTGIRVNAISPGTTDTDMVRGSSPEAMEALVSRQLLRRVAQPEEMVGAVLLLASDAGSFITGQVIFVDGGMVVAR
jgi:NAD(P)-dependent dehydrogenase (short-subunit alcohol dehydrogenase family)